MRRLPPGSPQRDKLIAFGDPMFNDEQAAEAAAESGVQLAAPPCRPAASRSSAALRPNREGATASGSEQLPRLPDTADELRSIALALQADPTKALHLGKEANEQAVKRTDLSGFKIVAFATHGLVPGELDGLTSRRLPCRRRRSPGSKATGC